MNADTEIDKLLQNISDLEDDVLALHMEVFIKDVCSLIYH